MWPWLFTRNRRLLQLWQSAMAPCGMDEVETSGLWGWRAKLTARSGPIAVRITDADGKRVRVEVEGPEGFSVLKLRRQPFLLRAPEIEVGDGPFDDQFFVDGPVGPVRARLDGTLRGQLIRTNADCKALEIGGGKLRAEMREEALPRVLPLLLEIGRQLAEPVDVEGRIANNVRRDPKAKVRLFNLLLLVRERPGAPETLEVLRTACSDRSSEIRLRAAIELGEEGRDILLKLAETSPDDATRARVISHLGSHLPLERVRHILSRSWRKSQVQTARACVETLGHRGAAAVRVLAKVMAERTGELATAAARALGTTGEAAAEPPLLQALQSEDKDLREAATAALGRVGTAAAVQPLQEAAERFWLDPSFRQAARQSIGEIQARLEGASPGQLSLAGAEEGQLSLATEAGQLSLATEAGQLSLAPHEAGLPEEPRQPSQREPGKPAGRPV